MGGKAEKGTPKYIANKIKAKGLQKLRWYCQMCQKQCRDENGFKCHTMSESHQRQLLLFADNANKYIDEFSKEFADGYLELLHRQFGTKRVNANKVYQEYISHRDHLHMNATQWETLTEFVKWLGREGKCVVDETEKGWFVAYIDRDPAAIAALEAKAKKEKMDKDDQKAEPLPVSALKLKEKIKEESSKKQKIEDNKIKQSALDEIIQMQERAKERANRKDYWLCEGIVVKITTKSLGDKFYKKKAVVEKISEGPLTGRVVKGVQYEDISKLAS
ncbi:hypothetical protein HF086_016066 [Spodoptera exigua]|uniref:DNA/RNA-binding protein Kin17 WH-like domain-containing protein n=1 Tax=Spodoptera exigua TaxID=7107 RepID=A0A922M6B9_SPOEX|nr:hypothetical protein HF086_016066 [Spodoptera exigua]